MTPTIALFGATYFELKPLLRRLTIEEKSRHQETHIYRATWQRLTLYVVRTGVGKKKAEKGARQLLKQVKPDWALSVGLCGAIDPKLHIGETLFADAVLDIATKQKMPLTFLPAHNHPRGLFITADAVLGPREKKAIQKENPEALACDMESSALASLFAAEKIPFAVMRTVSDRWDHEFLPEKILLEKNVWRQMQLLCAHSKWRFPVALWQLLRLGWHAHRAVLANTKNIFHFFIDTSAKQF